MKIALVNPAGVNGYQYFRVPHYGLGILGTILSQYHQVRIFDANLTNFKTDELIKQLLNFDAVGITCITATAPIVYYLSQALKEKNPHLRVVLGGPHVTFLPEEALEKSQADCVVCNEAENVILDIFEGSQKGIIRSKPLENLDLVPPVDFSLFEKSNRIRWVPFQTSRGCPYNCTFCSVHRMFGRRMRYQSPEILFEKWRSLIANGFRTIFITDDHFGINPRITKEFLEQVSRKNLTCRWVTQTRAQTARNDQLLQAFKKSGCETVLLGLESVSPETLEQLHKQQDLEEVKEDLFRFRQAGLKTHGMFIFGADSDTEDVFSWTLDFCKNQRIETAQFGILIPLPGTETFAQLDQEKRIFTYEWGNYDGFHTVFHPLKMSAFQLQKKALETWQKFYSFRQRFQWALIVRPWLLSLRRQLRGYINYLSSLERPEFLKA